MDTTHTTPPLRMFGGLATLFVPFGVMLLGIAILAAQGAALPEAFWPVMLAAIFVGLLLARDKQVYVEALIEGIGTTMLGVILLSWFLANVLGEILAVTGLPSSLVWASLELGITAAWFPVVVFFVSCLLSLATGTLLGTIFAITPVLFPAGFAVGADPYLLIGAIVGGSMFGNQIAPMADNTIVSAYSQGTTVPKVVRTRLPYAGIALALTTAVYVVIALVVGSAGTVQAEAAGGARPLLMLLVPALLIGLMLSGRHFVEALLYSIVAATLLALLLNLAQPHDFFSVDKEELTVGGMYVDGITGTLGVVVFTVLLLGMIGTMQRAGFFTWIIEHSRKIDASPRRAEFTIVGVTLAANAVVAAATPAMVMVGDFVRRVGQVAGIAPWRRANVYDALSNCVATVLPYSIALLIPYSMVAEDVRREGYDSFSVVTISPFVFYSWVLLAVYLVAVVTGWRRELVAPEDATD